MSKTPEEIKKGLVLCYKDIDCTECPYADECFEDDKPYAIVLDDALAYIQQLESKLNQAVEDIRMLGRIGNWLCPVCAHYNHGEGTKGKCVKCFTGDGFRWRGEKEEEHAD